MTRGDSMCPVPSGDVGASVFQEFSGLALQTDPARDSTSRASL
jgi:hypothetical protein